MIKVVPGELLDSIDQYIVQLNNCVSVVPKGFSLDVVNAFPWADPYGQREVMKGFRDIACPSTRPDPGTIQVFGDEEKDERLVVSFYAQYGKGRPYSGENKKKRWKDSTEDRKQWFKSCLDEFAKLNPHSVGFPYGIGCGYAGGDWKDYEDLLQNFADENPKCRVNVFILQ